MPPTSAPESLNEEPARFRLAEIKENLSILPLTNVPGAQRQASNASTTVDYLSELDILSRASKVRLSGIVCTIGKLKIFKKAGS